MIDPKEYHRSLHEKILKADNLADWIYHDVRLNCDDMAVGRSFDRFRTIEIANGREALFGVAASWAIKAMARVERAMAVSGQEKPAWFGAKYDDDDVEPSRLSREKRATISATQFVTAVSNDDLEMAEAILNAAAETSDEDKWLLLMAVLESTVNLSNDAYEYIYANS